MDMTLREKLVSHVREQLERSGKELEQALSEDTSLVRSGLLESMVLLELATWIEEEIGKPLDLRGVDIRTEWDTFEGIERFIERSR